MCTVRRIVPNVPKPCFNSLQRLKISNPLLPSRRASFVLYVTRILLFGRANSGAGFPSRELCTGRLTSRRARRLLLGAFEEHIDRALADVYLLTIVSTKRFRYVRGEYDIVINIRVIPM